VQQILNSLFLSLVFASGVQCTTSAFGDEPRRMLKVNKRLGKNCSCHLQDEFVCVESYPTFRQTLQLPS
jgi:hypothetical protein